MTVGNLKKKYQDLDEKSIGKWNSAKGVGGNGYQVWKRKRWGNNGV